MLETITKGFRSARHRLQGYRELDEDTLDEVLADIRASLLEADVEFGVVKKFLSDVKEKALGETIQTRATDKSGKTLKVSPQDHFIKICHDELVALMQAPEEGLKLQKKGVSSVMMVGLQGSGKTTSAGKLAYLLKSQGHRPMLVAADIYRPAAIEQLKVLGLKLDVPVFSVPGLSPPELCEQGFREAAKTASPFRPSTRCTTSNVATRAASPSSSCTAAREAAATPGTGASSTRRATGSCCSISAVAGDRRRTPAWKTTRCGTSWRTWSCCAPTCTSSAGRSSAAPGARRSGWRMPRPIRSA